MKGIPMVILLAVSLVCSLQSEAQCLTKATNGYIYKGEIYNSDEGILELLVDKPFASQAYVRSIAKKKAADFFGYSSLGFISSSVALVFYADSLDGRESISYFYLSGLSTLIGSILGLIGLSFNSSCKTIRQKEVVDHFNENRICLRGSKSKYKIGIISCSQGGIGIVLTF